MMDKDIRPLRPEDWEDVRRIYQQGINKNAVTFQTSCPAWREWDSSHLQICRFVSVLNGKIAGWIALTPVSDRCVYAGVAEVSIYIADEAKRKGIATQLLQKVITSSEEQGIWTLQSSIQEENAASIGLHKKCGFREVGYREKIARDRFQIWRNTVLMEHRSKCDDFNCCACKN